MAQATNSTLRGFICYNDFDYGKQITLPSSMSFAAMESNHGNVEIRKLRINCLDGAKEAVNDLLDFSVAKIPAATGLEYLEFYDWRSSVVEVEPEILTLLAY